MIPYFQKIYESYVNEFEAKHIFRSRKNIEKAFGIVRQQS